MTEEEFKDFIRFYTKAYRSSADRMSDDLMLKPWRNYLMDEEYQDCMTALQEYIATTDNYFPPPLGKIRKMIAKVRRLRMSIMMMDQKDSTDERYMADVTIRREMQARLDSLPRDVVEGHRLMVLAANPDMRWTGRLPANNKWTLKPIIDRIDHSLAPTDRMGIRYKFREFVASEITDDEIETAQHWIEGRVKLSKEIGEIQEK